MNRRRFLATVGAGGLTGLAGCAALASSDGFDVGMTAVAFDPPELTVSVGDTVVWKNTSSRRHTVTAYEDTVPDGAEFFASGGYDSEDAARRAFTDDFGGVLDNGETFEHTFEVPGRYDYVCIPHEQGGMVGAVVVEE